MGKVGLSIPLNLVYTIPVFFPSSPFLTLLSDYIYDIWKAFNGLMWSVHLSRHFSRSQRIEEGFDTHLQCIGEQTEVRRKFDRLQMLPEHVPSNMTRVRPQPSRH